MTRKPKTPSTSLITLTHLPTSLWFQKAWAPEAQTLSLGYLAPRQLRECGDVSQHNLPVPPWTCFATRVPKSDSNTDHVQVAKEIKVHKYLEWSTSPNEKDIITFNISGAVKDSSCSSAPPLVSCIILSILFDVKRIWGASAHRMGLYYTNWSGRVVNKCDFNIWAKTTRQEDAGGNGALDSQMVKVSAKGGIYNAASLPTFDSGEGAPDPADHAHGITIKLQKEQDPGFTSGHVYQLEYTSYWYQDPNVQWLFADLSVVDGNPFTNVVRLADLSPHVCPRFHTLRKRKVARARSLSPRFQSHVYLSNKNMSTDEHQARALPPDRMPRAFVQDAKQNFGYIRAPTHR